MSFRAYFNSLAEILSSQAASATIPGHHADTGFNREVVCREFLSKHLSRRLTPKLGGVVLGSDGSRSNQQDILICHDMSMAFRLNEKVNVPVESLSAAISVKTRLDKESIHEALAGLTTIPQCDPAVINLHLLHKPISEYVQSWPSLFVFAFDGVELETCIRHVASFEQSNSPAFNRRPRAIIVNGKYALCFLHYDAAEGKNPVRSLKCRPSTRGAPLFWLLTEISKALTWLDGMHLRYQPYFAASYSEEELETHLNVAKLIGLESTVRPEPLTTSSCNPGLQDVKEET